MLLYNSAVSGNCYKVRLICAHLGLPLELLELDVVDRSNRPGVIGQLSPVLRVPVLVLDDGRPLIESNAIIDYLAEGTQYMPRTGTSARRRWRGSSSSSTRSSRTSRSRGSSSCSISSRRQGSHARSRRAARKGLEALERGLTGKAWLVGEAYSVADISLYAYTHVAAEGGFDLEPYPGSRAWIERVAAQPGHITIRRARRRPRAAESARLAMQRNRRELLGCGRREPLRLDLRDQILQLTAMTGREVAGTPLGVFDQHDKTAAL